MKPVWFIFTFAILLSHSLNGTAAPVSTDNPHHISEAEETWMDSLLPSGVTMKKIWDWETGMQSNKKKSYKDALNKEVERKSEGKQMTARELLVLRIRCQGTRYRRNHPAIGPVKLEVDKTDLNKIFRPGLTNEDNEENAILFESLDDGDDPADEQWKDALLPPPITVKDIHSWEKSLNRPNAEMYMKALREDLIKGTVGKELTPKDFKTLLIQCKRKRYLHSQYHKNVKPENSSEDELLPEYVTMTMVENWEGTMSKSEKEIYMKELDAEVNDLKNLQPHQAKALKIAFRGNQYVMAQTKKRHANPLTQAQKDEITTWIYNLKLKGRRKFPFEGDDPQKNKLLPEGLTMELIRKWEAKKKDMKGYVTLLKRAMMGWMEDQFPLHEIQDRLIQFRGYKYLDGSRRQDGIKRKREETETQPSHNPPPSPGSTSANPPAKRKNKTDPAGNNGDIADTPSTSSSFANAALSVEQPARQFPPGTISLEALRKTATRTHQHV